MCVVPKPSRADYTLAKSFCPISLLDCFSKLVEKTVACLICKEIDTNSLVLSTQFGGRRASSTLNAMLTLTHDVKVVHTAGLCTGILLFNIAGFFDNVNRPCLVQIVNDMGIAPELVNWMCSFLDDHMVRLKFNGALSDPFPSLVGTPQGLPISPVLLAIYTSLILSLSRTWHHMSLGMYVDDGILFACGKTWDDVTSALSDAYTSCANWLMRSGLCAEPEKTELLFFRKRKERVEPQHHLHLPLPSHSTYYQVTTTSHL